MPTTLTSPIEKIRNSKPASAAQLAIITRLERGALQNEDDHYDFTARLAAALGFSDEDEARSACESLGRERISTYEATCWINVLKAMCDEPRCTGYCGQRGVQHSHVRYYDDHYDYECGLS